MHNFYSLVVDFFFVVFFAVCCCMLGCLEPWLWGFLFMCYVFVVWLFCNFGIGARICVSCGGFGEIGELECLCLRLFLWATLSC